MGVTEGRFKVHPIPFHTHTALVGIGLRETTSFEDILDAFTVIVFVVTILANVTGISGLRVDFAVPTSMRLTSTSNIEEEAIMTQGASVRVSGVDFTVVEGNDLADAGSVGVQEVACGTNET
jgi:hypothetical protein